MRVETKVDDRGRILLPKKLRDAVGLKAGDSVVVTTEKGKIVIQKTEDPFKTLEEILGDLTFSRELRKEAEKMAEKLIKNEQ